jgi:hypothetical protein
MEQATVKDAMSNELCHLEQNPSTLFRRSKQASECWKKTYWQDRDDDGKPTEFIYTCDRIVQGMEERITL